MLHLPTGRLHRQHRVLIAIFTSFSLSLLLAIAPLLPSAAIPTASVPNPRQTNGTWVTDMAYLLSPAAESELNQMISALEAANGTEIAIVTVPDTQPSASPKAFATELFNSWGIGKEGIDNGLLFLVSKGDRRTEIETGYGIEGVLPDAQVGEILRVLVTPKFKEGDFEGGILAGTESIIAILEGESFAPVTPVTRVVRQTGWLFGILFNGVWVAIAAVGAGIFALLKQRFKQQPIPLPIAPVGRSILSYNKSFWRLGYFVECLAEQRTTLADDLSPSAIKILRKQDKPFPQQSLLIFQRWNEYLLASVKPLAIALAVISGLLSVFLRFQMLWVVLFVAIWLGYELWCHERWLDLEEDEISVWSQLQRATRQLALVSFVSAVILGFAVAFTGGAGAILLPFVPMMFLGTYAGLLRLVRSRPGDEAVICQQCDSPMQRLSHPQLEQQLSEPQRVEYTLGSQIYEGWHCPSCHPAGSPSPQEELGSNIHLFSYCLNHQGFKECGSCQALTVETDYKTIKYPTTLSTGLGRTIEQCHCCSFYKEEEVTIPKKVPRPAASSSTSSSYSSYSGSYSGGSSGGSSGGGYSGSDFGGGSSGGGGAGDSW